MTTDIWWNCYNEGWGDELVPEAFSHPAKGAPGLSKRIYDHAFEEGWLSPGALVLDPFGGVAGFGLQAMAHGCEWVGVELEKKFVDLGAQNIALWNGRYSRFPRWCSRAVLLQGDSRNLLAVVGAGLAEACVSSPPFAGVTDSGKREWIAEQMRTGKMRTTAGGTKMGSGCAGGQLDSYGSTPGNLGNLRPGDFDAAVSSPPYAESMESGPGGIDWHKAGRDDRTAPSENRHSVISNNAPTSYGSAPGQLGSMRPGDFAGAVSSPPYVSGGHHPDQTGAWGGQAQSVDRDLAGYGHESGQLGQMKEGDFAGAVGADGVVISPPYEANDQRGGHTEVAIEKHVATYGYGYSDGQLGGETGDTFWAAALTIVQQTYAALRPGGHATWVVKSFVRNKAIVDFPGQWRQLCESCGFVTLHEHHAMLVAEHGQTAFDGTHKRRERKSFFRRLAESKGSPPIDYEVVLCQVKN